MAEEISKDDVAELLAKSQALTPQEGSNKPIQNSASISPEDAVKLAEKHENKTINSAGEEIFQEVSETIAITGQDVPPDLTGLSLDEQIAKLQEYKTKKDTVVTELEAPDLTGMSIDEQIDALSEYKAKQDEQINPEHNTLASVEKKAQEAGIDGEKYINEYTEKGELSKESYASLEKAGFDKVAIDAYIEAREVKAEKLVTKAITDVCGTTEKFTEMADWMKTNLSQPELDRYNAGVKTENYQVHLENMYLKFQAGQPKEVRTLRGNGNQVRTTSDSQGYTNQGEMIMAMQDGRYKSDPEYRKSVQQKVALMR